MPPARAQGQKTRPNKRNVSFHSVRPNDQSGCMIERPFWTEWVEASSRKAPMVGLSGVRRVGKTTLARQFQAAEHLNCDLPSVQRRVEEPESFFRALGPGTLVLDEVHQLPDPSRLLKIGTDAFPGIRIRATGSSTLAATDTFRDSLTGRKRAIHLTPVRVDELAAFGVRDLRVRLHRGGGDASGVGRKQGRDPRLRWCHVHRHRANRNLVRAQCGERSAG